MPKKGSARRLINYEWILGEGPSVLSLERMLSYNFKPRQAPGEAWFMGGTRRMYKSFIELPADKIEADELQHFLFEATSGLQSFYNCPEIVETYQSWLKFLIPHLVRRAAEGHGRGFLIEAVISSFFRIYAAGIETEYKDFREDILQTIGRATMVHGLWDGWGEANCTHSQASARPGCDGELSASLFFCLIYLRKPEIYSWVRSLLAIDSNYYRVQLLTWLVVAHGYLSSDEELFSFIDSAQYEIDWENSCLLHVTAPALPKENLVEFFRCVRELLSFEELCTWIDSIAKNQNLYESIKSEKIGDFVADKILAV